MSQLATEKTLKNRCVLGKDRAQVVLQETHAGMTSLLTRQRYATTLGKWHSIQSICQMISLDS